MDELSEGEAVGVVVRRATPEDASLVHALLCELAAHEGAAADVHVEVEDWPRLLADPGVVVLVALDGADGVGYVSAVRRLSLWRGRDILALDDLYVRLAARGRGVGGRLMAAVAAHAAAERLGVVRWEVEPENHGAHRFYRRLGATLRPKTVAVWDLPAVRPGAG
jgi:GNAT superfamily N-acetyltransferase